MQNTKTLKIIAISLFIVIIFLIATLILLNKAEKLTDKNSVSVYFVKNVNNQEFRLTSVKRKISPDNSKILTAITELLKGPSSKEKKAGFYTEIPSATKLLGIEEKSNQVIINLSKSFESGGGSTSMSMRLEQLVNTSLDTVKNKPVYLELDGKKVDVIGGEGVMVPQPLSRNLSGSREN